MGQVVSQQGAQPSPEFNTTLRWEGVGNVKKRLAEFCDRQSRFGYVGGMPCVSRPLRAPRQFPPRFSPRMPFVCAYFHARWNMTFAEFESMFRGDKKLFAKWDTDHDGRVDVLEVLGVAMVTANDTFMNKLRGTLCVGGCLPPPPTRRVGMVVDLFRVAS
jgi:hypothetical protein